MFSTWDHLDWRLTTKAVGGLAGFIWDLASIFVSFSIGDPDKNNHSEAPGDTGKRNCIIYYGRLAVHTDCVAPQTVRLETGEGEGQT